MNDLRTKVIGWLLLVAGIALVVAGLLLSVYVETNESIPLFYSTTALGSAMAGMVVGTFGVGILREWDTRYERVSCKNCPHRNKG